MAATEGRLVAAAAAAAVIGGLIGESRTAIRRSEVWRGWFGFGFGIGFGGLMGFGIVNVMN